jgi:hypothetical protein
MKIRSAVILGITLLFGTMAFAQDYHKIEVTGDYSYVHANPQNNNVIPTFSLNGGGGSAAFYFSKLIGIERSLRVTAAIRTTLRSLRAMLLAPARSLVPFRRKATCSPTTSVPS